MTGFPPDDGAFPGRPGEPSFPGSPGERPNFAPPGPQSGQPSPQQPHQPQQPQPGPYGPGFAPPTQPGYGVPGGGPPQWPPAPGGPGRPGSPGRRKGLLVGGIVAAVLVLVAGGGIVVWTVADGRPYASLPTCRQLLPSELLDRIPGSGGARVEGDYTAVDDPELVGEEDGYLGGLFCTVTNSDDTLGMHVNLSHYDYEDGGEAAVRLREVTEEARQDWEEGKADEENAAIDWRPVSAGDGGMAMLFEGNGEYYGGEVFGSAFFSSGNVSASIGYTVLESTDDAEVLDFLSDFAGRVDRQLSREGERA